jgi:hypothetical protein
MSSIEELEGIVAQLFALFQKEAEATINRKKKSGKGTSTKPNA